MPDQRTAASKRADELDRLGVLERELAGFQGEVRTQVQGLKDAVGTLLVELRNLSGRVQRPLNLGAVVAGAGVVVALTTALVSMGASPHLDTLQALRADQVREHQADVAAAFTSGQASAVRSSLDKNVDGLLDRVAKLEDEDYDRAEAMQDLVPLRAQLLELREQLKAHELRPGHGTELARVDGIERALRTLEERVARVEGTMLSTAALGPRLDAMQHAVDQLRSDVNAWLAVQAGR